MATDKRTPLKPPRLFPGDSIGIAAPSGHFNQKRFYKGVAVLESMGFKVYFEDDLFSKQGYLAGDDQHRAAQLNRLFVDPNLKAIICARGGYGALRILPLLDFESIKKHPKIFVGYSDVSALLSVLGVRCGLVTFHGPMVTTLANTTEKTATALLGMLTSADRLEIRPSKARVIKAGQASGPVAGGNLTTLCHLVGTAYAPNYKGRILLLEDRGEAPYRIDRMLTQMKLSGCFEGLGGLFLGSFQDCGSPAEIRRITADIFSDADIPVLAGFDIGHGKKNLTLPLGLPATLDTDRRSLEFHESATV